VAAPIFLQYDQEALDREYNNRGKVPGYPDHLARWAVESERARAELPAKLDLRYGEAPGETLDVFLPPPGRPQPAPVQVFIHGGYWMLLDKRDFSFVARGFHDAGALAVLINYALIPSVSMDGLVRQCRAAIAWTHRNAAAFGGDPDRLYVSGHSAGGHLTAMALATDWSAFAGLPLDAVKGGCGISGLYDLEPIRLSYLNDTLGLTSEVARRNSPIHLAPARSAPLLLPVGGLEGPEYHRQSETVAAAWRARRLAAEVVDLPGQDHFSIVGQLLDARSELSRLIARQMGPDRAGWPS
jgi:arylformamidase